MMSFDDEGFDRRLLLLLLAGVLFGGSWVLFVDGFVIASQTTTPDHDNGYKFKEWTPGLVGTLAFVLVNIMRPSDLQDESLDERDRTLNKAWFFFAVLIVFTSLTLGIVFHVQKYSKETGDAAYPGTALILQAVFMGASTFLFFFSRSKKPEEF